MNLVDFVFQAAADLDRWSEPAVLHEAGIVTYQELFQSVRACGGMFRALGVQAGDRIGIAALDCPEFIISFLGSAAIGAVAVPASTMLSASELGYILQHSAAKLAVVTADQLDKIREVRYGMGALQTVLLVDGQSEDTLAFSKILSQSEPVGVEPADDESAAFILYTSGTTGPPKGAVHVHRNLPHTVRTYCRHILQIKPEDRLFSSSRLFFAYGLGNSLSFPLASGASAILCKPRPTPPLIARIFRQYRPTIFFAVPADGMNRVVAHVVARDATVRKNLVEALKGQVSERLPAYKCPEEIHLSGGLPRTATGKLQRFKLRQLPG